MSDPAVGVELNDQNPDAAARFLADVLEGLAADPRTLPCKYLYDERGSELFEQICDLEEYYPTRTELSIMQTHAGEMAARLGRSCLLIEYGSGSSRKTRLLLDRLRTPVGYVPIDISPEALEQSAHALSAAYPDLEVLPVAADYTEPIDVPVPRTPPTRSAVYFPGSTIGNLAPAEAIEFLRRMSEVAGPAGGVLVGVDLRKAPEILEAAYDDREGVTAAFNENLLVRMNRELGARVPLDGFEHRAHWNAEHGRVEMHLVCTRDLSVQVNGACFDFVEGESIHTESSYKYELDGFAKLAENASLEVQDVWTDDDAKFSVQYLEPM